ncbi:hypothetical protein OJAV_G00052650 [Oryzias javanicus]|uniref:Uncharacterized protein n=1 Tax=Oryzias javanicus TaxID=123683 RepID=A0A437D9W9_ORYJA|nr:hypothetical protein OJAV_G00052650 [Oryzias javanicus]
MGVTSHGSWNQPPLPAEDPRCRTPVLPLRRSASSLSTRVLPDSRKILVLVAVCLDGKEENPRVEPNSPLSRESDRGAAASRHCWCSAETCNRRCMGALLHSFAGSPKQGDATSKASMQDLTLWGLNNPKKGESWEKVIKDLLEQEENQSTVRT